MFSLSISLSSPIFPPLTGAPEKGTLRGRLDQRAFSSNYNRAVLHPPFSFPSPFPSGLLFLSLSPSFEGNFFLPPFVDRVGSNLSTASGFMGEPTLSHGRRKVSGSLFLFILEVPPRITAPSTSQQSSLQVSTRGGGFGGEALPFWGTKLPCGGWGGVKKRFLVLGGGTFVSLLVFFSFCFFFFFFPFSPFFSMFSMGNGLIPPSSS